MNIAIEDNRTNTKIPAPTEKEESELNRKEINKLVHAIKNLKLSINDTKGFKSAEVAALICFI